MMRKALAFLICVLALALAAGAEAAYYGGYELNTWASVYSSMTGAKTTAASFTAPSSTYWYIEPYSAESEGGYKIRLTPGSDLLMEEPEARQLKAGLDAEIDIPKNVPEIGGTGDHARGLSGAPFNVTASNGDTFSGKIGKVYSPQELVEQKCVPSIELVGYPNVTAVKVAMVTSPDFSTPAKYGAQSDVVFIHRVDLRTQNKNYRIFIDKNFGLGDTLEATALISNARVKNENGEWVPIPGLTSIPADEMTMVGTQWRFSDMSGGESVNCEDQVTHAWRFNTSFDTNSGTYEVNTWAGIFTSMTGAKTSAASYTAPGSTYWYFTPSTINAEGEYSYDGYNFNFTPNDDLYVEEPASLAGKLSAGAVAELDIHAGIDDVGGTGDYARGLSGVRFSGTASNGDTFSGKVGRVYSQRELVEQKCVPSIELVGYPNVTAVKVAMVIAPDFSTPVKYSNRSDVVLIRRVDLRTRNNRYRIYLNKSYGPGDTLEATAPVANARVMNANGEYVPIPGGLASVPADEMTVVGAQWFFSDKSGGEAVNCEDQVSHTWRFNINSGTYQVNTWAGIYTSMTGAKTTAASYTAPGSTYWYCTPSTKNAGDKFSYEGYKFNFTPNDDLIIEEPASLSGKLIAGAGTELDIPAGIDDVGGSGDMAKALSGVRFNGTASNGGTFSGKIGHVYSQQELVDQKCVPSIELVGYPNVTAVKVAMVTAPDFSAPVKYSNRSDVVFIHRVDIRTQNKNYRIYIEKNFGPGDTLEATALISNARVKNENGAWVPITGLTSISADEMTMVGTQWRFSDMSGGESVNCEDQVMHAWRFNVARPASAVVNFYALLTARSRLFGGRTTPDSYNYSGLTGNWEFLTEFDYYTRNISHTFTFNANTDVYLSGGLGPYYAYAGATQTFDKSVDMGGGDYSIEELYGAGTANSGGQTAISGVPFTVSFGDYSIYGRVGTLYSTREMVASKCVPSIELIGRDEITALKWAFVKAPDFSTPVTRSTENGVRGLRRFYFRTQSNTGYPFYRCEVDKTFAQGAMLSGETVFANANLQVKRSATSQWEGGRTSIPESISSVEVEYIYDGGDFALDEQLSTVSGLTLHSWCFTNAKSAPAVEVQPADVSPAYNDPAIYGAETTNTNADAPDDLDGNIVPSQSGAANKVNEVVASITLKVDYNPAAIAADAKLTVEIAGDFSNFTAQKSNLCALIKSNADRKYHKFPILSIGAAGMRFELPVPGFFSEKNIIIAEVRESGGGDDDDDDDDDTLIGSSSGCSAGALALSGLAAFAVIARKRKFHF